MIPIIFLGGVAFCARRYDDMKYAKRHKELQIADFLFVLSTALKCVMSQGIQGKRNFKIPSYGSTVIGQNVKTFKTAVIAPP